MQRKTFHLVAIALLALGVVVSVVGGVGERFTLAGKRTEPAPPASAPAPAPKAAPEPGAPSWSFAPRRPIDETAAPTALGNTSPSGPNAAPGAVTPGASAGGVTPGFLPYGGSPGAGPRPGVAYDAQGRPVVPGAPGSGFTRAGPTAECPRGTFVRAGSAGPQVFCAND